MVPILGGQQAASEWGAKVINLTFQERVNQNQYRTLNAARISGPDSCGEVPKLFEARKPTRGGGSKGEVLPQALGKQEICEGGERLTLLWCKHFSLNKGGKGTPSNKTGCKSGDVVGHESRTGSSRKRGALLF